MNFGDGCRNVSAAGNAPGTNSEEAAEEAIEAAAWYERERVGLGVEFSQAVNAAIDLLEEEIVPLTNMPGTAGSRGVKRLLLKRFPYDVVVRELPEEVIVVALAHHSRRPILAGSFAHLTEIIILPGTLTNEMYEFRNLRNSKSTMR